MNHKFLLLLPIIAVAVGVSVFSFDEPDQTDAPGLSIASQTIPTENAVPFTKGVEVNGVKDNVEIIVTDPNGNIKYQETVHNKVVTHGENCAAKMLFGTSGGDETGTTVCVGAINNGFNFIGLGEGVTAVADADTDLENPADETGLATPIQGTITWTNSTTASFSTVLISSTFTNAGASETIEEVALFNATSSTTRGMYAHAQIASAVVANGDDITINWTFETGEATVP